MNKTMMIKPNKDVVMKTEKPEIKDHTFVGTTHSNNPELNGIDMYLSDEDMANYKECFQCGGSMGYWESQGSRICGSCDRGE